MVGVWIDPVTAQVMMTFLFFAMLAFPLMYMSPMLVRRRTIAQLRRRRNGAGPGRTARPRVTVHRRLRDWAAA